MFTLSQKALATIETLRPGIISKLALALNCSDGSINRYIRENEENGDLTKFAALKVLREETGLTDAQIINDLNKISTTKKTQAA